jgi:transaldolase
MAVNPLLALRQAGQSAWLDDLTRQMLDDGTLEQMIREDGLSGITSNPKIFKKAIASGERYDAQIEELADEEASTARLFEKLAVQDVRRACDLLREVYDRTSGEDGFVSLEVSPRLARDTVGTIDETLRLWEWVDRPNVFIKIPGTAEGIPAIRACLERGVNVNVTLLFSLDRYDEVIEAWFGAMQGRLERGLPPGVKSVASFFLSRIDAKVDPRLDELGAPARPLRGRTAVACAKLAYALWQERFADDREAWRRLRDAGAIPQKLLWASTSTKDPAFRDTKYVESLIGPRTVCTMPRETLEAFRDHGVVGRTLEQHVDDEQAVLSELAQRGVDLQRITDELEEEGIDKFVEPYEELLETLDRKRQALAGRG